MKELKNSQECSTDLWRKIARGKKISTTSKKANLLNNSKFKYKLAVYIRLSPSDEIREEGSLTSHPQRIKGFVKMKNNQEKNWGRIVETYTDKDLSGKNMNRPAFQKMCRNIVSGKINAVVVTELSRLSRSVKDFCQFWDFLKEYKVKFFSLKENFDTSTAMGELMVIQAISFAQFERQTTVERIKHGVVARAERGLTNGGQRLLGYDPHPDKKCHLVVNEKEKPIVGLIFKKFLELGSLSKTLNFLNQNQYTTKSYINKKDETKGGNRWTSGTLHGLLTNLAYIGKRELNKCNRGKDQSELNQSELYKVYKSQWPAIISKELFNDVQSRLEKNKKDIRRTGDHIYVLSGLIYCGLCGEKLVGVCAHGRDKKYFYYGHKRKMTTRGNRHMLRCHIENIPAHNLEEAIYFRVKNIVSDKRLLLELAKNNTSKNEDIIKHQKSIIQSRIEKLKAIEADLDALTISLARATNTQTQDIILGKIDVLAKKLSSLKEEIERLKEEKAKLTQGLVSTENVFSALKLVNKKLPKLDIHQKKRLLSNVIAQIIVYKDRLAVQYKGDERMEFGVGGEAFDNLSIIKNGRTDWI